MRNQIKSLLINILTFICVITLASAYAQPPMTVRAFVSSGGTSVNTYAAVGQPFFEQINTGSYEVAYGLAQSQLELLALADETCINEDYSGHGFNIPASDLSEGTTSYEKYENNVYEIFGYDRLTKLDLTVWPVYAVEVSETFSGTFPIIDGSKLKDGIDYQVVEGDNIIIFLSMHNCDSVVTLHASLCPFTVMDADSNVYATVVLDKYCWTQSNLKTKHYIGASHAEVPKALVYSPGEDVNENIYGRLYTWFSAVNIPEDSTLIPPPLDIDGFVTGICPEGWHIPASPEITALESHSSYELRSPDLWLLGAGANTTGFTLLPAGYFKASVNRFEDLRLATWLWKATSTSSPIYKATAYGTFYNCDAIVPVVPVSASDAYSVRCVKNY